MFPNSAPDSLTPKYWKLLTLFFFSVYGAATARTAVLAITRRLLKGMMRDGAGETTTLQNKYYFKLWEEFDQQREKRIAIKYVAAFVLGTLD
jgi:hypothetical protein